MGPSGEGTTQHDEGGLPNFLVRRSRLLRSEGRASMLSACAQRRRERPPLRRPREVVSLGEWAAFGSGATRRPQPSLSGTSLVPGEYLYRLRRVPVPRRCGRRTDASGQALLVPATAFPSTHAPSNKPVLRPPIGCGRQRFTISGCFAAEKW